MNGKALIELGKSGVQTVYDKVSSLRSPQDNLSILRNTLDKEIAQLEKEDESMNKYEIRHLKDKKLLLDLLQHKNIIEEIEKIVKDEEDFSQKDMKDLLDSALSRNPEDLRTLSMLADKLLLTIKLPIELPRLKEMLPKTEMKDPKATPEKKPDLTRSSSQESL